MRAIWAACAAVAALSLTSCDIDTGKPAQTACHCTTPPPATPPGMQAEMPPPVVHHRRHRHDDDYAYSGHARGHAYYWHREWSEASVQTYDYHSDSHSYSTGGGRGHAGGGAYGSGSEGGDSWVDGYGRRHDRGASGATHAGNDRARRSVWHGYDEDCPDGP